MKKTAAIILLCLMVFNTTGYRLMVQWMQQQQCSFIDRQLDVANYDEAMLIELAVPLSLPYYNNWNNWERYEGEIQLNGQTYTYVKRKVVNGQLLLKCLPNPQQQIIQREVSNAFAQLNGLSIAEKGTNTLVKQPIKAGCFEYEEIAAYQLPFIFNKVIEKPALPSPGPAATIICLSPWQPPEIIG